MKWQFGLFHKGDFRLKIKKVYGNIWKPKQSILSEFEMNGHLFTKWEWEQRRAWKCIMALTAGIASRKGCWPSAKMTRLLPVLHWLLFGGHRSICSDHVIAGIRRHLNINRFWSGVGYTNFIAKHQRKLCRSFIRCNLIFLSSFKVTWKYNFFSFKHKSTCLRTIKQFF